MKTKKKEESVCGRWRGQKLQQQGEERCQQLEAVGHLSAKAGWSVGGSERGDEDVVCWEVQESWYQDVDEQAPAALL